MKLRAWCWMILLGVVPAMHAQFVWNGGDLSALLIPGNTILPLQTLQITTGSDHDLQGQTLTNQGTINWDLGYIRGGNGSQLIIASGGNFNDLNASGYTVHNPFGGSFTVTNNGTYTRNAGGTTFFDVPFINNAALNLQQGVIEFRAGGSVGALGTITASTGTVTRFTSGFALASGATLTGPGAFQLTGGTMTLTGDVGLGNFTQAAGAVDGTFVIRSGTIFDWNDGVWSTSGATTATIAAGATLNINTGADHNFQLRSITNQGTVNWNAGYIRGGNGSVFTNAAGATFNDLNSSGYTVYNGFGGSFTFVNNGTYVRNTTGTSYFDVPFVNNAFLNLQQGSIQFRAGGTLATSASIAAAAGTSVFFTNGFTLETNSTLAGAGSFNLTGGTMAMNGNVNIGSFTQTGGVIAGIQTIASGVFNWNAGTWSTGTPGQTTTFAPGSILNVQTGADHNFEARNITNNGTVNWYSGYLRGGNGSVFTNAAGGTFNDANASSYTVYNGFGGSFTFVNNGTYLRNVGGATYFDVPFENNGTVNVQQGSIVFRNGGTISGSASINTASGAGVEFTAGFNVQNGASLTGAGAYSLSGGTLNVSGNINVSSFTQTGGVFAGTNTIMGGSVFNWDSGTWNSAGIATTTIAPGAVLNIRTGSDHNFEARTITNTGTINWQTGYIRGGNGSVFNNAAGATFNDLNASSYTMYNGFGGQFEFNNAGLYVRNAPGTTFIDTTFNNTGTVSVQQGTMEFRAGGTMATNGSIAAAPGTAVSFTNGFTINNGASLTGTGAFLLTGGTLTLNGSVNVGSFSQTSGTLTGTNTIASGTFNWQSGSWDSAVGQSTTIGPGATLNILTGADHNFQSRAVVNQGTVVWQSGYIRSGNGGSFVNAAGGTFHDLNASSYTIHNGFGGTFTFENAGRYVRSVGGTTFVDVPFVNTGTLEIDSGTFDPRVLLSLESTGTLGFSIGGTSAGTDYGVLNYGGNLTLNGMLQLDFRSGFETSITSGNAFTLVNLSAGSLSGAFTNVASGSRLTTSDGLGSFLVNYGASSPFGTSSVVVSGFQAVPEPSTWGLLATGAALVLVARRSSVRRRP